MEQEEVWRFFAKMLQDLLAACTVTSVSECAPHLPFRPTGLKECERYREA
jgi:hypothetical protein